MATWVVATGRAAAAWAGSGAWEADPVQAPEAVPIIYDNDAALDEPTRISALILVAVSWIFTRRLTRPLEQLRQRMQSHRPGQGSVTAAPIAGASPEMAAIAVAHDELLQRYERHERERALLLAGVSHDLRSPLARIRMAAALLPEVTSANTSRFCTPAETSASSCNWASWFDVLTRV